MANDPHHAVVGAHSPDAAAAATRRVPRRDPAAPTPLSFAQQRLWFLDQLMPGSTLYNISFATKLEFRLDVRAFRRGLRAVVARHESLRTVFGVHGDEPVQVVRDRVDVPLTALDMRAVPSTQRLDEARRAAAEFQDRPFDLRNGPLVRVLLIWLDVAQYHLVISMHHIVSDGWSLGVFAREMEQCYTALAAGREPDLAPLPIQYGDFAAWQHESQGDLLDAQLDHWCRQLRGAPVLELPTDRVRPPVQAHRGAEIRFTLPAPLVERLSSLARANQATTFMVTMAAFDVVIARWAGQDDVVIGVPIAGRPIAEVEPLIGFFVNTLALRVDLGGSPTFTELVGRVRSRALDAYAHADLPFERLVEGLRPARDLSRNPIVQAIFQLFESAHDPSAADLEPAVDLPTTTTLFDLRVDLAPRRGDIVGRCEYDTDLFDRSTIQQLCRRFVSLLEQVVENPNRPIASYEQLLDEEHVWLAGVEWGGRMVVPGWSVGELFGRRLAGGGLAVVAGGRSVGWEELAALSAGVTERLVAVGVGAGSVVGVAAGVSLEQVVAVTAVLRLGACWVPLDPELPPGRVAEMIDDAGVGVVVVSATLDRWWSQVVIDDAAGERHRVVASVVVDGSGNVVGGSGEPAATPLVARHDDAPWVLFTSGSSGRPKGVIGSAAGLLNRLWWWWRTVPFQDGDRAVLKTRPGFVDAITELLGPMLAGVPVVVADDDATRDPTRLAQLIVDEQITHLVGVPSLLAVLFEEHAELLTHSRLRVITSSGEMLSANLITAIRRIVPSATIVNLYGSTEISGDATALVVQPDDPIEQPVTIGRPIDNVAVRVLDDHARILPPGAIGELYVGGAALTGGYLDTVDPTDHDRFVTIDDQRWFRTGDLARWTNHHTLHYLGRHDRQTKVRGVRVEPAGIEHTLITLDHITDAAVITRHHPTRGTELIAYIVLDDPTHPLDHIRHHLRTALPTHHQPTQLFAIDHIPRLTTGKIDHTTLTNTTQPTGPERSSEPPRTDVERLIAGVFAETTSREGVGRHDDFFADLGGHSLLATRAVSRLRNALRRDIPLALLFERPTCASLGEVVAALPEARDQDIDPIPRAHRGRYVADTPAGR